MGQTMQQIMFSKHQQAELTEVTAPVLSPVCVAGRTLTSVISAGTELGMQYLADDGFPHWPGYGAVFEVDEMGDGVDDARPGDRVFCMGKHASRQCFPRDRVICVPRDLLPETAVLTRMGAVGWAALSLTGKKPPAKALVTGLGAVGHFAARAFAMAGYEVAGVDPSAERRALLQQHLDAAVFDRVPLHAPGWQDQTDIVLECSGRQEVL